MEILGLLCLIAAAWLWRIFRRAAPTDPNRVLNLFGVIALIVAGLGFLRILIPLIGLASFCAVIAGLIGLVFGQIPFTRANTRRRSGYVAGAGMAGLVAAILLTPTASTTPVLTASPPTTVRTPSPTPTARAKPSPVAPQRSRMTNALFIAECQRLVTAQANQPARTWFATEPVQVTGDIRIWKSRAQARYSDGRVRQFAFTCSFVPARGTVRVNVADVTPPPPAPPPPPPPAAIERFREPARPPAPRTRVEDRGARCGNYDTWEQAQAAYKAFGYNRMDRDGDGIACESLPGAP